MVTKAKNIKFLAPMVFVFPMVSPLSLSAQEQNQVDVDADPFRIFLNDTRPLSTIWQTDYSNTLELGLAYTSDENIHFGEYSGLNDSTAILLGNLRWQQKDYDQSWLVQVDNLGMDTRSGIAKWKFSDNTLWFKFDNTIQTRDNTGSTPFAGESNLTLPASWVPAFSTGGFANLDDASHSFTRSTERQKFTLGYARDLLYNWSVNFQVGIENKSGTGDIGAAIYIDAANPQAVLLPLPIDYRNTELSLDLNYSGDKLQWMTRLYSSEFVNNNDLLQWQNPYASNLGTAVDYPAGIGALALAPDNQYTQLRSTAVYQFSAYWRMNIDASTGIAKQNDDFANYTVNPALSFSENLPRTSLDGELQTNTLSTKLDGRLTRKLSTDLRFRVVERDNQSPRDAYLYIRGDGGNQPSSKFAVYNTTHSSSKQTAEANLHYRLPKRTKLSANYEFERIVRENAAVETTEEERAGLTLSLHPFVSTTARFEVNVSDLAADTYQWDQSYFSLFDAELINETPDNQRYLNHPLLSQYQLSNRESTEFKVNVTQTLGNDWQTAVDFMTREIDYDKSILGLTYQEFLHSTWSLAYIADENLQFSLYLSYDELNSNQSGRTFGGGIEKNAFDIYMPISQASDPSRNWHVDSEDQWTTAGFNVDWLPIKKLKMNLDYRFVDTQTNDGLENGGAFDLDSTPFPQNNSNMHHLKLNGEYALRSDLSLNLGYQYYRDSGQNWSNDYVLPNSINKVLTFGDVLPNEVIHYVSASVIYRW